MEGGESVWWSPLALRACFLVFAVDTHIHPLTCSQSPPSQFPGEAGGQGHHPPEARLGARQSR